MKKILLSLFLTILSVGSLSSQCVGTCSSYAVSQITYTTFTSAGTNPISTFSPNTDDGVTPLIPLGFNFNFYCTTYSSIWICTNGFIQFNNGVPAISTGYADPTQTFPSPVAPNAMVALNMNDLDNSPGTGGGTITYTTIGVSPNQKFIVTYSNVPVFGYTSNLTNGQIVLYETSNIIEIYTTGINNNGLTAGTQGIEDAFGSLGAAVPGRNNSFSWPSPITNTAYQFAPFTPAPPAAITGNTLLCEGDVGNYQASFIASASNYNWSFPSGWLGTSSLSAITATTGATGGLSVTATYTCGTSLPTVLNVSVSPAPIVAITSATPGTICSGKIVTFNTSGAATYTLNPGGINGVPTFTDMPLTTTIYTLSGTSANGCVSFNNSNITVIVNETPLVAVNNGTVCLGGTFTITPSGPPTTNYAVTGSFFNVTPPAGQYTYSVVGTSTNGCASTPAVSSLTVYAPPVIGASASRTVMCVKESVVLTATGTVSYLWGNGSSTPTISVGPITNTFYVVTGTDVHGCKNTATVDITVKLCTGIDEALSSGLDLKIYPNPTNGFFKVQMKEFNDKTVIEIYNALGELITKEKVLTEVTDLNLKTYSDGLYYVKVKNSDQERTIKVIKQ